MLRYGAFLISIFSLLSWVHSTVSCNHPQYASCRCSAPYDMDCEGRKYRIDGTDSLDYLEVIVTDLSGISKRKTLKKPPGPASDYFTNHSNDIGNNRWIISQLSLKYGDKVEVVENGFGFSDSTKIYDPKGFNVVGSLKKNQSNNTGLNDEDFAYSDCEYVEQPQIVSYPGICKKSICVGRARCGIELTMLYCDENGFGYCPTANECANDKNLIPKEIVGIRSKYSKYNGLPDILKGSQ